MLPETENTGLLPLFVIEIISLIGEAETQQLVKHLGGMSFYFPGQKVKRSLECGLSCISHDSWQLLCKRYGGTYVFIPKCYKLMLNRRNTLIRVERAQGLSIQALCRKFNLTDRQIMHICGKAENKHQLDWLD